MRAGSRIRKLLLLLLTLVVFDLLSGIAQPPRSYFRFRRTLWRSTQSLASNCFSMQRRAYFPLSAQFVTQENQGLFGIASLVMVLNALHIPAPESARLKPFTAFDQSNIAARSSESIR
jgi:hypothetical protein